MKIAFIALLIIHLLIHLVGFLKAFGLAELPESGNHVSKIQGVFWLATTILFIPAVILYMRGDLVWTVIAIPAALISQVLIILNWKDAKFGTIANLIIIVIAMMHFAGWQILTS